jgi:prolyl-tRNA synthetase
MLYSKFFIPTLKEAPADADIISAKLMVRSGMIRKLSSGLYEFLPLGFRVLKKAEAIIRQELDAVGGQEVMMPLIMPKELWEETGRWGAYGKEMFRLKDRKSADFCLAPTHEEAITDLARREIRSYRQLPFMFHQFTQKFRDEIRPRFGVMRAREFLMSDAYSFHEDKDCLKKFYEKIFEAYIRIFTKCGFNFRPVEAAVGTIGGFLSHEFMVLAKTGEEEIAWCDCGYASNSEKTECLPVDAPKEEWKEIEKIYTPNIKTVEDVVGFLNTQPSKIIKAMLYLADKKPVLVLIRGDKKINEVKLQNVLGVKELAMADRKSAQKIISSSFGSVGPVGLQDKVEFIADLSVENISNAIAGANEDGYHLINVCFGRDFKAKCYDIRQVAEGDVCPQCKKEKLQFLRGIEVGHTFMLGTKYSKSLKATYFDKDGKENFMEMGCYGIGVSRIIAAMIEQSHDENGIIWTKNLNPFCVEIIPIDYNDPKMRAAADEIYAGLTKAGIDVLLDDRDERAGVKFGDADLIGIPFRITIGKKTLEEGKVEFRQRCEPKENTKLVEVKNIVAEVLKFYDRK